MNTWQRLLPVAGLGVVALAVVLALDVRADLGKPRSLTATPYVGSGACKRCHPSHYESFHRTYHRSMTQLAEPSSVLGNFDGTSLDYLGVRARMRRGPRGEFMMSFSGTGDAQSYDAVIERCVGSHRYQQYLARDQDVYFRLPIAWDVSEQRFIHMNGAFLTPDPLAADGGSVAQVDYNRHVTRWNDNCVFCHNVHPNPGLDPATGRFDTQVAELGVACEACHGPGAEHAARNANPLRRYALHTSQSADPTIRNPARLPAPRSAQICGRCHGQRITGDIARFQHAGDPFIPGQNLEQYSKPLTRDTRQNGQPGLFAPRFWADSTPRLTAYEYQGFLQSPCARSAKFSCESCHAMHAGDPSGQLRPNLHGDQLCTTCHNALAPPDAARQHSHHNADPGIRCVSCHMPDVVYGLVSVRLSHRIEVPSPTQQAVDQRPDACTLCHVDRSRRWAQDAVRGWNRRTPNPLPPPSAASQQPEQMQRLLAGDAIERAVAATALGKSSAHYAAGYRPQLLGLLIDVIDSDPYPAVRAIAQRSLRNLLEPTHPQLATRVRSFAATDNAESRHAHMSEVARGLANAATAPEPALTTQLRGLAKQVAIEIGE